MSDDRTEDPTAEGGAGDETSDMGDLLDELTELEEAVDTAAERDQVRETMRVAMSVRSGGVFGRVVHGFGSEDLAEAFLGALLLGIPMAVEDGTLAAGAFVARRPLSLVGTLVATVVVVVGILYVADFQDVRVADPILGVVPRRLVGVLFAALVTALLLFTAWGRVSWSLADPAANWEPLVTCLVAAFPMAIGGALGDILPGN